MVGKHKYQKYWVMAVKTPALKLLASYCACGRVRNLKCLVVDEVSSVIMAKLRISTIKYACLTMKSIFKIYNNLFSFDR